ncbi:amidase domain-containing protein [Paenibacillus alginolyticus]|uniref:Amidase domain-containing protein n=1 Tax=Paenibacillus alginolyticus TaxID=59839 RepID=A0ABT4GIX6_9BACL|nr:amidase domain-containing protein [Paenibacillus alginolyticus]MCY9666285.1 amidase domain-containing protein [Paenibacillus alginolyticus]MCY9695994.1 amidase domain-containing protein [Paenibacillus alginolyticus]MEC0143442.1 amidase domain-containing protein [Paenibacillus alginolyticus]
MSWKTALYNYVHAKNQAEIEGSAAPLEAYVSDSAYVRKQDVKVRRLLDSYRDRDAKLLRGETKLRLTGVKESPQMIIADIQLHRFLNYRIGTIEHLEERIEPERVFIDIAANRWQVRYTESLHGEKSLPSKRRGVFLPDPEGFEDGLRRAPSLPYINYSILNSAAQESAPRKIIYNRAKVVQYAETWWQTPNPKYEEFEVDCTNFVSQCLFAGGAPMDYTGKRDSGWWYAGKKGNQELWSFSWAVANSLQKFLSHSRRGLQGHVVDDPSELQPGDTISYDWDGDGRYQHNTIVIGKDANGMPLVNAHTYNSRNRYWAYQDSPAWTERTKYVFVRVADQM